MQSRTRILLAETPGEAASASACVDFSDPERTDTVAAVFHVLPASSPPTHIYLPEAGRLGGLRPGTTAEPEAVTVRMRAIVASGTHAGPPGFPRSGKRG